MKSSPFHSTLRSRMLGFGVLLLSLSVATAVLAAPQTNDGYFGPGQVIPQTGGYSGPGLTPVSIQQAKQMRDDEHVVLRGYIIQSLGDKDYLFKDDTGTITVEIGKKVWRGQQISDQDLVEIHGEIDKEWGKAEIEIKQIFKQ